MKYQEEFRNSAAVQRLIEEIRSAVTRPWSLMEVCGGQTHSLLRNGLDQLLPGEIRMIHGPGCPVCVTPLVAIDRALAIASRPEVIFCSFGDMLRVPGSHRDLFRVRSEGGDVRIVYSPLDAIRIARENSEREVVFFAIGFETTAPANAMAIEVARRDGIRNFSALVSHVLVPPAIEAILSSPRTRVNAFLAAGHVCSVMGTSQYPALADKYKVPIVVTGFEPYDLLVGILGCVRQLERGEARVENAYARAVNERGNLPAQQLLSRVFTTVDRAWRGIGMIPDSGWKLSEAYRDFDAERRFAVEGIVANESPLCRSGEVLQGLLKPNQCPAFGKQCTPRTPLGATMVSTEGACSAYFHYGRLIAPQEVACAAK